MSEPKPKGFLLKGVKLVKVEAKPTPARLATELTAAAPVREAAPTRGPQLFQPRAPAAAPVSRPPPKSAVDLYDLVAGPPPLPRGLEAPAAPSKKPTRKPLEVAEAEAAEVPAAPSKPTRKPLVVEDDDDLLPRLELQGYIDESLAANPYVEEEVTPYYPDNRRGFTQYITARFAAFKLPQIFDKRPNPRACDMMTMQTYKYQAFIREYMRNASPYRGVLVYHGLGSGKTCTSIAAAEAIYSQSCDDEGCHKKIIIMTPASLRQNFLNELGFCGFRHHSIQNYWVPFELKPPGAQAFARTQVGIPSTLINSILRRPEEKRVFWMPDLSKPKEESNYNELEPWEQLAIREQINAVIQNTFEFISYNGVTSKTLKEWVAQKTHFDNAVIIIDEVHNITRGMYKRLDKYLQKPKVSLKTGKAKERKGYEPVTIDPWVPKYTDKAYKYEKPYLLYRLLCQAKNSKIIALSGTPMVNNPTELGILGNILHGYFHTATTTIATSQSALIQKARELLDAHPRIGFYDIRLTDRTYTLFFSVLDESYEKVFAGGELQGLLQEDVESMSIQDIFAQVVAEFKKQNIPIDEKGVQYEALPLFPPVKDEFEENFIDKATISIKNKFTYLKRFSGLVSYYKGSKEELMPKVTKDEIVKVHMSPLQLPAYSEARKKELDEEERLRKQRNKFSELAGFENDKEAASYRFLSRSICNFVFPKDIKRPLPRDKKELTQAVDVKEIEYGEGPDLANNAKAIQEAEAEVKAAGGEEDAGGADSGGFEDEEDENAGSNVVFEEEEAAGGAGGAGVQKMKVIKPYPERIRDALNALRERKYEMFVVNVGDENNNNNNNNNNFSNMERGPENYLDYYSPKYNQMLINILTAPGSSLVYSNYKTVEGLGTFAIALEANGFDPIEVTGTLNDMDFTEATKESLMKDDTNRYILYTGDSDAVTRSVLLNIFNMNLDKLPPKIKAVLQESSYRNNMDGGLCRVFMITGAGAEGLSLKNVRQVHIMEPHWNRVRTEQVKGRAVRICSHKDFPDMDDRTVEVYTYLCVFDPAAIKGHTIDETLLISDGGTTTDEYLYGVSEMKGRLSDNFLDAMKQGAVDCQLNYFENGGVACYGIEGTISDFLFDPRLKEDLAAEAHENVTAPGGAGAAAVAEAAAPTVQVQYTQKNGKNYFISEKEEDGVRVKYVYRTLEDAQAQVKGTELGYIKPKA